jgi:DNA-binding CsgD family transcriptional regulator
MASRFVKRRIGHGKIQMTQLSIQPPVETISRKLSPRAGETLAGLLEGLSEKQIAGRLGISKNTVHTYVKAVYSNFQVSSRSELLAIWIGRRFDTSWPQLPASFTMFGNARDLLTNLHAERARLAELLLKLDQEIAEKKKELERRGDSDC